VKNLVLTISNQQLFFSSTLSDFEKESRQLFYLFIFGVFMRF